MRSDLHLLASWQLVPMAGVSNGGPNDGPRASCGSCRVGMFSERRSAVRWGLLFVAWALAAFLGGTVRAAEVKLSLATFEADVTPPLGHRLLTGLRKPAEAVDDPLAAKGFVLLPQGQSPIVYVSVDWAEIRNDAYDRWRDALALAAGTSRERVLVSCIHQHDTPLADLAAQRMLEAHRVEGQIIDLEFHEQMVARVARAVKTALATPRPVTHLGLGRGEAKQLASNRRFLTPEGVASYGRYSVGRSELVRNADEGTIDATVKSLSFWHEGEPLAVLSVYATHPMSYYGTGRVSADFPGRARALRQAATPGCLQIYASGCSGNVTVGKYNDGTPALRPVFAERLSAAMKTAFDECQRVEVQRVTFKNSKLKLEPRDDESISLKLLKERFGNAADPRGQELAALGLSWFERLSARPEIDVPCIDFGPAAVLLLPAEIYVEYQLFANAQRPDGLVLAIGYGECAPGYIPIERAWEEHDENLRDWCWVAPGMQPRIEAVIETLLK